MSTFHFAARALAWLALAFPCAQAWAQTGPDAADPQAAVPPTLYQPAMRYRAEPAPAATPDRNWIASNAAVAGGNAMAGHEPAAHAGHEHHAGMAMVPAGPAPQQCKPGNGGKDGKEGKSCCAGMTGGAGHEHHAQHARHAHRPGMAMPAGARAAQQCMACQGGCACCGGKQGAGHRHGAAS